MSTLYPVESVQESPTKRSQNNPIPDSAVSRPCTLYTAPQTGRLNKFLIGVRGRQLSYLSPTLNPNPGPFTATQFYDMATNVKKPGQKSVSANDAQVKSVKADEDERQRYDLQTSIVPRILPQGLTLWIDRAMT